MPGSSDHNSIRIASDVFALVLTLQSKLVLQQQAMKLLLEVCVSTGSRY